jgi:Zn-dependent M28 family amino/carboxypeptidase
MKTPAALLLATPLLWAAAPAPTITPAELSATVKVIASDAYQGRAPGTEGETKTIDYLVGRFRTLGLQPGGPGGQWTQAVPMIHNIAGTPSTLKVDVGGAALPIAVGRDISPATTRATDRVAIENAPLVFVGYGVSAPERGWDDFKGVDLHGKVAVILVNDPDYEAQPGEPVAGKFGGQAMTYYGRWTYKFEEAARQGAIGALLIHEDGPAGYGWNVAGNTVGGTYALPPAADAPAPVALRAWISHDFATQLLAKAGLDLAQLKVKARSAGFRPVPLEGAHFSIDMPVQSTRIESHNVLAKIPGKSHADEAILYGAHWDAYGVGAPDAEGRTIRPGANDDGLGVAGVLALARAFKAGSQPDRTIVFGLWTAEERGLLGSEYYAQNPVYPAAKTVGALTIDILQTAGLSRDVVLIGAGQDSLETDLAEAAAKQGRTVTPDAKPERGLFYRADHFSLAKRGVPTLLLMGAGGGADLVNGGREAGDKWVSDYTAHCYHQTCDTWSADWDLRGAAQDVSLFYTIGRRLADSREWPVWNRGSEFAAIRETTASERR